ncbi:MAG TPA: WD40 repeat domain-containing protein [Planctomycetota bacterium]|nr:WD40 repeat domain-containing protein [Planctomycetota bacterium]
MIRVLLAALLVFLQDPKPRVDLAGDPLPEGAVCRLGTRRWRTPGRVWSLAFGKDGKTLLVGAGTSLLSWDVEKNERRRVFQGHRGVVGSIAPHPDGFRVLTGAGDGTMVLWNLETGARIRRFEGHQERVWTVALSKDGSTALSAGMDGTLGLWNVETGERTRTFSGGHKGPAMCAVFVKDETQVLSGGADGRMILWDAATGARLKSVEAHKGEISGLAIGPDGRTAVTTCGRMIPAEGAGPAEGGMAVWDLEAGRRLRVMPERTEFLWASFMPDGKSVIAGCADRTAGIWDLESGTRVQAFEGLGDRFHPVAIRDGVVAIGDGTAVSLFEAATGKRRFDVPGHSDGVGGVAFLPDGRPVTAGADGWLATWDASTGRRVASIDTGGLEFGSLAVSPDGRRAVTGGWRTPAALWDLESGACLARFESGVSARGVAFGPATVATGLLSGKVVIWDSEAGTALREFPGSPSGALAMRRDGKLAIVPAAPKAAAVVDVATGRVVRRLEGHARDVTCMAFSEDGSAAATGGADGRVILWDGDGEKETKRLEAGSAVRAIAFGPRGLVAAAHSTGLSIWDATSGRRLASYQGHSGGTTSVAINREGTRAITGSGDTTAIVWTIP